MGAPVVCAKCQDRNSFLALECRGCGEALPGKMPPQRRPSTRVPAAVWIGPDIHVLWTNAGTLDPQTVSFNLHELLHYCELLRRLREAFTRHDTASFHDACLFFLRGSYGLWAYLNKATDLRLRAIVFGGLNHGSLRKPAFAEWLQNTLREAGTAKRKQLDLMIVDEVDSGTGIGTQMNVINDVLDKWAGSNIEVRIKYLAVARPDRPNDQLSKVVNKWSEPRRYSRGSLYVTFDVLVGALIAYDDDDLLGIARNHHSYQVLKHDGANIVATCPCCCHTDCAFAFATAGIQNESIANVAAAIASAEDTMDMRELDGIITRRGCPQCRELWCQLWPATIPSPQLHWRDRLLMFRRALCRQLIKCRHLENVDT